jgi:hypothetical protein
MVLLGLVETAAFLTIEISSMFASIALGHVHQAHAQPSAVFLSTIPLWVRLTASPWEVPALAIMIASVALSARHESRNGLAGTASLLATLFLCVISLFMTLAALSVWKYDCLRPPLF